MAAGKPIITTALGQLERIISHGINGIFTDNTVEALATNLRMLKANPELRGKLGANARKSALDYYNWDRVALETESVLIDAIKTKGHHHFPH